MPRCDCSATRQPVRTMTTPAQRNRPTHGGVQQWTLEKAGLRSRSAGSTPARAPSPRRVPAQTPKTDNTNFGTIPDCAGFTAAPNQPPVPPLTFGSRDTAAARKKIKIAQMPKEAPWHPADGPVATFRQQREQRDTQDRL